MVNPVEPRRLAALRRRAIDAQIAAQRTYTYYAGKMDHKSRPRSYKLDDQAYSSYSYLFARHAFQEYQSATQ